MTFFRCAACKLPRLPPMLARFCSKKCAQLEGQGSQLLKRWNVPWALDTTFCGLLGLEACFYLTAIARTSYLSYSGVTSMDPGVFWGLHLVTYGFGSGMKIGALYGLCRFYRPIPVDVLYWSLSRSSFLYGLVGLAMFGGAALAFPSHLPNFEQYSENPAVKQKMLMVCKNMSTVSSFFSVNLVGFTEEVVYRGFVLTSLTKWVATPTALLLSSVAFALSHVAATSEFDWSIFPQRLLFGLASGVAYLHSRNLAAPIALHCCYNSALFAYCLLEFKRAWPSGFYEQVVFQQVKRGR